MSDIIVSDPKIGHYYYLLPLRRELETRPYVHDIYNTVEKQKSSHKIVGKEKIAICFITDKLLNYVLIITFIKRLTFFG
jgi:hypothetical protein